MKHLKNIILVVATAIILILMTATIVESSKGTAFVRQHIYTSGWFVVLWGIFCHCCCHLYHAAQKQRWRQRAAGARIIPDYFARGPNLMAVGRKRHPTPAQRRNNEHNERC